MRADLASDVQAARAARFDYVEIWAAKLRPFLKERSTAELKDLFAELRYQYVIILEPGPRPGWHPLEIRTPGKNLVVQARRGYTTVPQSGS